jgi:SAM-dependent methyltransferase
MNKSDWWRPEVLARLEVEAREGNDPNKLDPKSDFGSYRMVLEGRDHESSKINSHNDLSPKQKVLAIKQFLMPSPTLILDAGCGIGATTHALAEHYPTAEVIGVDISKDAIDYASKTYKNAKFFTKSLSPDSEQIGKFSLIFCFEFYPFTRNRDIEFQSRFIQYFVEQLQPDGNLVIYQTWKEEESLASIYDKVRARLPQFMFEIKRIPHPKLLDVFPVLGISYIARIAELLTKREMFRNIVIIGR